MWQITEIGIYNRDHVYPRIVRLIPGRVNIITGKSHTGKTALLDIVNYCLGSDICLVSQGVIRDNADWFAIKITTGETEIFVAREAPREQRSSSKCMRLEGVRVPTPSYPELRVTTNIEEQQRFLSRLTGITPNASNIEESATRDRLHATIRHTISFILQPQYVIASPLTLFSNVEDAFKQKALIDVFPFFLGALQQDQLALEAELESARRDLKRAERKLSEVEKIGATGYEKAKGLLSEASQVGISTDLLEESTLADVQKELKRIVEQPILRPKAFDAESMDSYQDRLDLFRERAMQIGRQIRAAEDFQRASNAYKSETQRQIDRLEPLTILETMSGSNSCPLCNSNLTSMTESLKELLRINADLKENMAAVDVDNPELLDHLAKLRGEKQLIQEDIAQLETTIDQLISQQEHNRLFRYQNEQKARVIGRISLYLESSAIVDDGSPLREAAKKARERVHELEQSLGTGFVEEKLQAAGDTISKHMTSLAEYIDLEFKGVPLRIDFKALTVRVQRAGRPITLAETGSGANWVGYHLVSLLALHQFYVEQKRPVPRFLMIDQPSQVYFPPDPDDRDKGDINKMKSIRDRSEDRVAVKAMYELIFKVVKDLRGELQIIITDHADLKDSEEFQESVKEVWRDDDALIPKAWLGEEK